MGDYSVEPEEDDKPLQLAGKGVAGCQDVWDFLGGASGRGKNQRTRTREEPIVRGGWELLRAMVGMWEDEVRERKETGRESRSGCWCGAVELMFRSCRICAVTVFPATVQADTVRPSHVLVRSARRGVLAILRDPSSARRRGSFPRRRRDGARREAARFSSNRWPGASSFASRRPS